MDSCYKLFILSALLSPATWPGRDRRAKCRLAALLCALGGFTLLSLEVSRPLWTTLPFLAGLQFPWRFLAPATLALALLCGALLEHRSVRRGSWLPLCGCGLLIGALAVAHWGWLYPSPGQLPSGSCCRVK
ncbi:MAG: hypothetical protein JXR84_03745 [Anaerolineae bacterium]|nr:hypothetical protein [Anaerolineae bacterium]